MAEQDRDFDIITIRNIDDEDLIFTWDSVQYILYAGEERNFPRFLAAHAVKNLTDHILLKRDPDGKMMANKFARQELAAKIVVDEKHYDRPKAPTDAEVIDQINKPSDLDLVLKAREKDAKNVKVKKVPDNLGKVQEEFVGLSKAEKKKRALDKISE